MKLLAIFLFLNAAPLVYLRADTGLAVVAITGLLCVAWLALLKRVD